MRLPFLAVLLICVIGTAAAQSQKYCEPPAETRALIRAAGPQGATADLTYKEAQAQRRRRLADLVSKHPEDFWIRRAWIEASKDQMVAPDDIIAEAKRRAEADSKNPEARYLHAVALFGSQTPESIKLLESVLAEDPQFAVAHHTLISIRSYPRFTDRAQAQRHIEALLSACPDSTTGLIPALGLPDGPVLQRYVAKMRAKFDANPTSEDLFTLYSRLWQLEFKVTPVPEHAKVRERIAKDIATLKAIEGKEKELSGVIVAGYKILGDKENEKAMLAKYPSSSNKVSSVMEAMNQWYMKNPYPKATDPEEKRTAFHEARLKALDDWIPMAPDEPMLRFDRANTLAELPARPESEILAAIDEALDVAKRGKAEIRTASSDDLRIAQIYARRGIRLDQVEPMVKKALASSKTGPMMGSAGDLISAPGDTTQTDMQTFSVQSAGWSALIQAYLKLKEPEKARLVLIEEEKGIGEYKKKVGEWEKELAARPKDKPKGLAESMKDSAVRSIPNYSHSVFDHKADIALHENRKADALAFYQAAIREGDQGKTRFTPKAEKLWKELGGTPEGWQAWEDSFKSSTPGAVKKPEGTWTKLDRPMPEFQVSDLAGKTWTKTSINGKTTFINLWATWCAPCRFELPHLEKLYQSIKNREDVQLITLNVDDSVGLVEPFMKENKYTFPVLLAKDVVQSYLGSISIPRNWVVDRGSVLRFEGIGFDGVGGEDWIKKMTDQIEAVRGGL